VISLEFAIRRRVFGAMWRRIFGARASIYRPFNASTAVTHVVAAEYIRWAVNEVDTHIRNPRTQQAHVNTRTFTPTQYTPLSHSPTHTGRQVAFPPSVPSQPTHNLQSKADVSNFRKTKVSYFLYHIFMGV